MIVTSASSQCTRSCRTASDYCHSITSTSHRTLLTERQHAPAAAQLSIYASRLRLGRNLASLKCPGQPLKRLQQENRVECMAKSSGGGGKEKTLDNKKLVESLPDGRSAAVSLLLWPTCPSFLLYALSVRCCHAIILLEGASDSRAFCKWLESRDRGEE